MHSDPEANNSGASDSDDMEISGPSAETEDESLWCGYKFVGDNVDKNVKPTYQRHERHGQSLHYFHSYASKDRVNLASFSDTPPPACTPEASVLLPSAEDLDCLRKEIRTFVSVSML